MSTFHSMSRPTRALISASALRNNLAAARRCAAVTKLLAVIKANGYGHGLLRVASALAGADGFAVLEVDAAAKLRDAGFDQRILLLEGFFDAEELGWIARNRIATVVHSPEQLSLLEAVPVAGPLEVFLKLNTGMNRLGLPERDCVDAVSRLRATSKVGAITLMTHFACADDARGVAWQLERFATATAQLGLPVSLANSATLLRYPHAAGDCARIGIMLYGASPFADASAESLGLRPAMTLQSQLIAAYWVEAGESVGYGATFQAPQRTRIGVVACGYADGYPRHAGTGTPVLVAGRRTGTLGRVSMDMLCVDLTSVPDAGVGSPVVLWGEGLPVEEVAAAAGTISYELLCALAPRVPVVEIP